MVAATTTTLPNANVRRHNSLPAASSTAQPRVLRRNTGTWTRMTNTGSRLKFNPYVGWFRHSPDSSRRTRQDGRTRQELAFAPLPTTRTAMSSNVDGWTQNGSSSSSLLWNKKKNGDRHEDAAAQEELLALLHSLLPTSMITTLLACYHVQEVADYISGRLRGGSPFQAPTGSLPQYHQDQHLVAKKNHSLTLSTKLFTHAVAKWLLKPFLEKDFEEDHEEEEEEEDCCSSSLKTLENDSLTSNEEDEEDDQDYVISSANDGTLGKPTSAQHSLLHQSSSSFLLSESSSPEAEAYYAHQAAKELNPDEVSPARLNQENDSLTSNEEDEEEDQDDYIISSANDGTLGKPTSHGAQHSLLHQSSSSFLLSESSSPEAEAYYAHQAAKELNPDEVSPARLNHVITQMDIIRMQRNASRHLDVESIYQLPTLTYRKNLRTCSQKTTRSRGTSKEGWSWMLIGGGGGGNSSSLQQSGVTIMEEGEDTSQDHSHPTTTIQDDVCVICLEPFAVGDRLRVLPCNHSFHMGCIDRWLSGSASFDDCHTNGCPTCKKRPVVPPPPALPSRPKPKSLQDDDDDDNSLILAEEVGETSDGNVPSWAFCQLGSALLARDSQHF
eukprot:CAMPEP_0172475404 /NCGR_PEP_ID=MMETSP1065-20121228/69850_1 /TAXON_ID=265537 /ORGANISM="Amphiprora paludosa, Strain CCMP125" /LENGTH=610 /DNA_ID=CAMNT_0013233605 /DNA_START=60 /DNA_END=1892 /DNA_ORIENTATION=+